MSTETEPKTGFFFLLMNRQELSEIPAEDFVHVSDAIETVHNVAQAFAESPKFRNEDGTLNAAGEAFAEFAAAIAEASEFAIDIHLDQFGVEDLRLSEDAE